MDRPPYDSLFRRVFWVLVLAVLRGILFFGARVKVLRPAALPSSGPLLLASNHISHFDPPLLALAFPRPVDWMAMVELYSTKWSRKFFQAVNTVPVRRGAPDRAALRDAAARLEAGRVVGVFPEGGIRDGEASLLAGGKPLRGASLLARMTGARIVPAVILGSDRLYNRRRWLPGRRAPVWIAFGEAFDAPADDATFAEVLRTRIHALRDLLLSSAGAGPEDLPKPPRERMAEK